MARSKLALFTLGLLFSSLGFAKPPFTPDLVEEIPHPCGKYTRALQNLQGRMQREHPNTGQYAIYGGEGVGHNTIVPGPVGQAFIDYAATVEQGEGLIVDIGPGFGITTRMVAKGEWNRRERKWVRKPRPVIAVDLMEMNLLTLLSMASPTARGRITAWKGTFPWLPFEDESVQALNLGSVLHFFRGYEVDRALQEVFRVMKPGGKVFIEVQTPFLKSFEKFLPEYEANIDPFRYPPEHARRRWPGWIEDVGEINPARAGLGSLNLMDMATLRRAGVEAGFEVDVVGDVEQIGYFWRRQYPEDLNGNSVPIHLRDRLISSRAPSVGVILRKP